MRGSPLIANDYLQSVIRPVRRAARFWLVGAAVFVIVIAATLIAAVLTRQYRSEAVVYYREGLQWTANEGTSTRRMGQRLKDVVLARAQLAKIIEELGLYPKLVKAGEVADAVEVMRLATGFKLSEGDIFVISYTASSPGEAQRVTARLTDLLVDENARLRSEQAEVARAFFDAEKKRNASDLGAKEVELLRFLAKHPEFAHEQGALGAALRASTKRGPDATVPRGKGDNALGALRREEERLRRQISSPSQVPRAPRDSALVAAKNEAESALKTAQRELADRRARFTEQHPDVRTAAALVKETGDAYRRAVDALNAAESLEVEPRTVLEARLGQVQQDITSYQRKNPKEKAAQGDAPVGTSDAAQRIVALETEWARLNREVAEARERFQQLDSRQFMASMVASTMTGGQAAQIVVIDPAFLPTRPIGMSTTRRLLMGIATALAFGIGLVMLLGWLDDRVHDRADVERLELAPILIDVARQSLPAPEGGGAAGERPKKHGLAVALSPADITRAQAMQRALLSALRDAPEELAPEKVVSLPAGDAAPDTGSDSDGGREFPATGMIRSRIVEPQSAPYVAQGIGEEPAHPAAQLAQLPHPSGAPTVVSAAVLQKAARDDHSTGPVRVHRAPPPPNIDPRLLMLATPDSPAAASFRVLRHHLGHREGVKVLLVASPQAGEGKTLCALNLALALGEAGRARVLLLEANFRSPSLANLLGFRPPLCVSEQLELHRVRPALPWVVVESAAPCLHIAAVEPGAEARPFLDGPALKLGIESLQRAGYDYIVIDSPAILGSADVNLIEEAADGVLMTMWAGKSSARALRKAVEQIGRGKLLGIALFGT